MMRGQQNIKWGIYSIRGNPLSWADTFQRRVDQMGAKRTDDWQSNCRTVCVTALAKMAGSVEWFCWNDSDFELTATSGWEANLCALQKFKCNLLLQNISTILVFSLFIHAHVHFLLSASPELRKATIIFVMSVLSVGLSVCPFVSIQQIGFNWTDFRDVLYLRIFR